MFLNHSPSRVASLLTLIALATSPALARAAETVKVTVVAILATDSNDTVDPPCIECLAKQMKKIEPRLTGFRMVRATCRSLPVGEKGSFPLVEEQAAIVIVQHGADEKNRVSLKIKPPRAGEIVYTSACGKFFPIMTRYCTKDKERLILAIMVGPCKD